MLADSIEAEKNASTYTVYILSYPCLHRCMYIHKQHLASSMGSEAEQLHIVFFPLMAQGHMMPMIDMAKIFASRATVKATVILTPFNASIFDKSISRSIITGHSIEVRLLEFPSSAEGLPEGTENTDYITTQADLHNFLFSLEKLEQPFRQLTEELRPDCIVSDMCFPWTVDVAKDLGIPRLYFNGSNYFFVCVSNAMRKFSPEKEVSSDTEPFVVPGLPDRIELTKAQLPDFMSSGNTMYRDFWERIFKAELQSYGTVMNSFYELEHDYIDHCGKELRRKTWPIGPVSLCNKDMADKVERGKKTSIEAEDCLSWLDSKEPNSVLYICFGSLCKFAPAQHVETAAALESTECSFIWVVKPGEVLPEAFEQRTEGKGLIIRGWAPQVLILSHFAVGGFVTHCGWNSTLEAVSSGVPMITWPVFAEQFYNEKLVTQVLKIGVGVGVAKWVSFEDENREVVKREKVEEAIRSVMGGGEEGEGMRKRAQEMGEMARKAVEKDGSSYLSMSGLIDELRVVSSHKRKVL